MLRRILFFTGITLVVMLAFITAATRTVLMDGFTGLEKGFLLRNLSRVENAISDEIDSLGMTANDWAAWDETYRFARDRNSNYIESNLDAAMFQNLNLGFVLFLDSRGRDVYSATFDPQAGIHAGIPAALRDWLAAHAFMTKMSPTSSHAEGIVSLPDEAFIVAARPILDSRRQGPARGVLLMGRRLDAREAERLARSLRLSLSLSPLSGAPVPPGKIMEPRGPLGGQLVSVEFLKEHVASGSSILAGADGQPALLVKIEIPRDIHRQGVVILRYFTAWLLVIGIVFSAVVLIVIQRTVLFRLEQLSRAVLAIGTGGEPGRRVPASGRDQIAYLGSAINGMLEALEGSHASLRQSELRYEAFLDAIPDLLLRVTREGTIIDARFPLRTTLAQSPSQFIGIHLEEMAARFPYLPQKILAEAVAGIGRALHDRLPVVLEFSVDSGRGMQHFQARIVASGEAEVIVLVRDVTAEKRVEEAQRHEILVKEIHHRVKNNLQVISSLLGLQASSARDPGTRALLDSSRDRVRSMALIHEKLYQGGGMGGSYGEYVRDLSDHLLTSYGGDSTAVAIGIECEEIPMDVDRSVPVGLIINELLSNALAHAFPPGRRGRVVVRLKRIEDGLLELSVCDDGIGFPQEIDYRNPASLGLRIVNILAQQIKGTLSLAAGEGTTFIVSFPCA